MILTEEDRLYSIVRGSDVQRDGMYLELKRNDLKSDAPIAEIFYSDQTHKFTFTPLSNEPIPLLVLERFMEEAHRLLPVDPKAGKH